MFVRTVVVRGSVQVEDSMYRGGFGEQDGWMDVCILTPRCLTEGSVVWGLVGMVWMAMVGGKMKRFIVDGLVRAMFTTAVRYSSYSLV